MTQAESIQENGIVIIAEREIPVSSIVTQKNMLVDTPKGFFLIDFIELENREAFLKTPNGEWVEGKTYYKRWSSGDGRPERQTVFKTIDEEWNNTVIRSVMITV
jgi:hypothetical protein